MHVSITGGLLEAIARAKRLSCTTMQIFSRSPRGGAAPRLSTEQAERFDAERRRAGIDPLAIHGPYIINLASPERWMWERSVALFREEYARAVQLKAQYLVAHVGSHRGHGEAEGIQRVSRAINRTLEAAAPTVMILLENTAGSGQGLGYAFEQLAEIRSRVAAKHAVGFCLDTAHLFAAGHPIHTTTGLEEVLASFDRLVGLDHLKLIHLNDSKVPFDSRVDRHWHIGKGEIGLEALRRIVNHPRLNALPFILETPKKTARPGSSTGRAGEAEDRRNLATVKRLVMSNGSRRRARTVFA